MSIPKKYHIRYDRIVAVAVIFIVIIILIATAINKISSKNTKEKAVVTASTNSSLTSSITADNNSKPNPASSSSTDSTAETSSSLTPNKSTSGVEKVSKQSADIHTGDLVLVNSSSPYVLPNPNTSVSIVDNKTEHYYVVDNIISLNPNVISALNNLMDAYYDANSREDIRILSAYSADSADKATEFSTGLSFKIGLCLDDNTYSVYTATDRSAWITENAEKYGFITRYKDDKKNITGQSSAVDIFRYVGIPHAMYMKENNLCLEEYLQKVKSYQFMGEHLKINANSKEYEVYYVPANTTGQTDVFINPGQGYSISGNNTDGFIVTIEK